MEGTLRIPLDAFPVLGYRLKGDRKPKQEGREMIFKVSTGSRFLRVEASKVAVDDGHLYFTDETLGDVASFVPGR